MRRLTDLYSVIVTPAGFFSSPRYSRELARSVVMITNSADQICYQMLNVLWPFALHTSSSSSKCLGYFSAYCQSAEWNVRLFPFFFHVYFYRVFSPCILS